MVDKAYTVNQIFYSVQGEGVLQGVPMAFIRFSGCNLRCTVEDQGFDCDTEFVSGRKMLISDMVEQVRKLSDKVEWILLTGGEPMLQVDTNLAWDLAVNYGYKLSIETNGTMKIPEGVMEHLDWITVSPKALHTIRQRTCSEVRLLRSEGQEIPAGIYTYFDTVKHWVLSPAAIGNGVLVDSINWCFKLAKDNPRWRVSLPLHKRIGVL